VVGAGVSGLVVAQLLHRAHGVTVFEANDYPGGHANTVRVDTPNERHQVDTGFIVFNDRNYPNFERLLERLRVGWQRSTMSFSVSDGIGDFEYRSASPSGLFAKRAHLLTPWFHRMIVDLGRFNHAAQELLDDGAEDISLGDWLDVIVLAGVHRAADRASGVGGVVSRAAADVELSRALLGGVLRQSRDAVVPRAASLAGASGGSARYVEALIVPFSDRLRLCTPVDSVTRHPDHVLVKPRGGEAERFDEVVLATHSDQALALLGDASDREHEILGAIPYQPNEAVLHTDVRILPRASWNYHLLAEPKPASTVTHHMNRLQSLRAERDFCVTLNRTEAIDPAHVIRTIPCAHPVYTAAGVKAQGRVVEIDGRDRTHFCGAYWGWGFHEDGVVSALRVGHRFGARL
jgi:predicted NAD/FAD-binding protein